MAYAQRLSKKKLHYIPRLSKLCVLADNPLLKQTKTTANLASGTITTSKELNHYIHHGSEFSIIFTNQNILNITHLQYVQVHTSSKLDKLSREKKLDTALTTLAVSLRYN
jgi:hypothetical protein